MSMGTNQKFTSLMKYFALSESDVDMQQVENIRRELRKLL